MHALTQQRVQVQRQRGHQRLALTRLHLGDAPLMQHDSANQLYIEVPHVQRASRGFTARGERFRQNIVQRLAVLKSFLEFVSLRAELFVGQCLIIGFQRVDFLHDGHQPLHIALAGVHQFLEPLSNYHHVLRNGAKHMIPNCPPIGIVGDFACLAIRSD
jgi:hypothetical protein